MVLVGVTPDQGSQENWLQGEAKQVLGVFLSGRCVRCAIATTEGRLTGNREALESAVPGNSQAAFGGGPGEKGC